jgi:hypothetical protein
LSLIVAYFWRSGITSKDFEGRFCGTLLILKPAADEIFRVAAWTRSEFALSLSAASDKLTPKN